MTTGGKLILVGTALIALFYIPTLYALTKVSVAFSRIKFRGLDKNGLQIEVVLECDNDSKTNLRFQTADLHLFFNQYHVAMTELGIYQILQAKSKGYLSVVFNVPYKDILSASWNSVVDGKLLDNYTLTILGNVRVNNKTISINRYTFTAEEIENLIS